MKKKVLVLTLLSTVLGFSSCSNDLIEPEISGNDLDLLATKSLNVSNDTIYQEKKFFYKGETYEYTATLVNDSVIRIDNPEVEELLEVFDQNTNLVTYLHWDGIPEFFDNQEAFKMQLSGIIERDSMLIQQYRDFGIEPYYTGHDWITPYPPAQTDDHQIANLWLFDDENYDDSYYCFELKTTGSSKIEVSHLKDYDLNDKTTSLVAYNLDFAGRRILFELYEDSNFSNHSFSFIVYRNSATQIEGDYILKYPTVPVDKNPGVLAIPCLKDWRVTGTNDSWNDRISSIRISLM